MTLEPIETLKTSTYSPKYNTNTKTHLNNSNTFKKHIYFSKNQVQDNQRFMLFLCYGIIHKRGPFRTKRPTHIPKTISYENCSHFWDIFLKIAFFNFHIYRKRHRIRIAYSKYHLIIQITSTTTKILSNKTKSKNGHL